MSPAAPPLVSLRRAALAAIAVLAIAGSAFLHAAPAQADPDPAPAGYQGVQPAGDTVSWADDLLEGNIELGVSYTATLVPVVGDVSYLPSLSGAPSWLDAWGSGDSIVVSGYPTSPGTWTFTINAGGYANDFSQLYITSRQFTITVADETDGDDPGSGTDDPGDGGDPGDGTDPGDGNDPGDGGDPGQECPDATGGAPGYQGVQPEDDTIDWADGFLEGTMTLDAPYTATLTPVEGDIYYLPQLSDAPYWLSVWGDGDSIVVSGYPTTRGTWTVTVDANGWASDLSASYPTSRQFTITVTDGSEEQCTPEGGTGDDDPGDDGPGDGGSDGEEPGSGDDGGDASLPALTWKDDVFEGSPIVGMPYSGSVTVADPDWIVILDNSPDSFFWNDSLPPGLTPRVDGSTIAFRGAPTETGTWTFTIGGLAWAPDDTEYDVTRTFTLTVAADPAAPCSGPFVPQPDVDEMERGASYIYPIGNPAYDDMRLCSELPDWMVFLGGEIYAEHVPEDATDLVVDMQFGTAGLGDFRAYVVHVTGTTPGVALTLGFGAGSAVDGATVTSSGSGLLPGSVYTLTMHSTPVVLSTGVVPSSGRFTAVATLPAGTPSGVHQLVLEGVRADGTPVTSVAWFSVFGGVVIATSTVAPPPDPTPSLAETGSDPGPALAVGAAGIVLGALLLGLRRRRIRRR